MNWNNVRLIFVREVRDQLRDRRTLFMIAVLPLLLYPAMGLGLMQMTTIFQEQPRTLVILGADALPHQPLLEGGRFIPALVDPQAPMPQLTIFTDVQDGTPPDQMARREKLLRQATALKEALKALKAAERKLRDAEEQVEKNPDAPHSELPVLRAARDSARTRISDLFTHGDLQLVILIPDRFGENLAASGRLLDDPGRPRAEFAEYPRPAVLYNSALDKSNVTFAGVNRVLRNWEQSILKSQFSDARIPEAALQPVQPERIDVALEAQSAANLWSKLFPAMLVLMAMTGAFYPSVDLVAGEKERGTMETLLICPARRIEIVMGKFFTVMSFSYATAILNLASMGMTSKNMVGIIPSKLTGGDLPFPPPVDIIWILLLLIPLSALFSALCLALATFARSTKEGQYYLTPLMLVSIGLVVFSVSPAIELTRDTAFFSLIPVANLTLLLKGLLGASSVGSGTLLVLTIPVLISSFGYAGLALWWAIDQFNREEVLFREAEQFDLQLWIKHLFRKKEPTPTFAEAVFCFVLIMLLQFFAMQPMSRAMLAANTDQKGTVMLQLLLIQQIAIVATPPMLMGIMLTTGRRMTFRLRWPDSRMWLAAFLLPLAFQPLSVELMGLLAPFLPKLPEGAHEVMRVMSAQEHPWWIIVLTFAIAPAICEEIAFRGFLLSGFSRSGRVGLAVFLSAFCFGIIHMIPQQVVNATLMGLVLGLLAFRGGSLPVCMVFHAIYNSLTIAHGHLAAATESPPGDGWALPAKLLMTRMADGQVHYSWPTLSVCFIVAAAGLVWLIRPSRIDEITGAPSQSQPDEKTIGPAVASQ